jgi:hypothetical protein
VGVLASSICCGWLIAGPLGIVEPGANDTARGLELALDQEPHGESRRMPTSCRQPLENCVLRGLVVEMERLRINRAAPALL